MLTFESADGEFVDENQIIDKVERQKKNILNFLESFFGFTQTFNNFFTKISETI
jgi:hypothetical protein